MIKLKTAQELLTVENGRLSLFNLSGGTYNQTISISITDELEQMLAEKFNNLSVTIEQKPEPIKTVKPTTKKKTIKKTYNWKKEIQNLKRIVSKKNEYSILYCFQLTSVENKLVIRCTNNEVYATTKTQIDYTGPTKLVNHKMFLEILKNAKTSELCYNNDSIWFADGLPIETIENSGFPDRPEFTYNDSRQLRMDEISKIMLSASTDTIKPVFNCVYCIDNNYVATDSRRLAVTNSKEISETGIMIPLDLIKLLNKTEKVTCLFNLENSHAQITDCFTTYNFILTDGQFPNYHQVIPDRENIVESFTVNRLDFLDVLTQVKPFTEKPAHKAIFQVSENSLTIAVGNDIKGYSSVKIDDHQGDTIQLGFNVMFLIGAMKTLEDDIVKIAIHGQMSPMSITDARFTNIVMPIQIKEKDEE